MLGQARQWRPTLAYGFAHFGKSLFWYSSEILFAYFLTELAGLPTTQMGTVLIIGFLVSAGIDVALGLTTQRWLVAPSSAARIQLGGAVLCSVALAMVFLGAWMPVEWRFGYAIGAGIAFRLAFAIYDIPQNALMALATQDAESRLRLASTRIWFSGAATLTVAAIVGPLVARNRLETGIGLLLWITIGFALVAIAGAALLARSLPHETGAARPAAAKPVAQPFSSEFWLLIGVTLLTTVFTPAFAKFEPYYATYTLQSAWWGGAIILLMATGIVFGQPLWFFLCQRMSRFRVMIGAAILQLVALLIFWLAGVSEPWIAAITALGFGLGNGGVGMVQWAAVSETVASQFPGRASLAYGLIAASAKVGLAIGGALIALVLESIDFRGTESGTLAGLMSAVPGIGAALLVLNGLALLVYTRHGPDRRVSRTWTLPAS